MLRHIAFICLGNLDIIPEHPVVPHLEVFDAGAFLFVRFHPRDDPFAVGHIGAQRVHFFVVAVADHAAFPHRKGRVIHDRRFQQIGDIGQRIDPVANVAQHRRGAPRQPVFQRRDAAQRLG